MGIRKRTGPGRRSDVPWSVRAEVRKNPRRIPPFRPGHHGYRWLPKGMRSSVAKGLSGREASAEVLIFMSLSVPPESWREWAAQAERVGAPLVLRGVLAGGVEGRMGSLRKTAREVGARLGGHDAGVAIDPRLFRLFGVERVPAVAVVPGGVPACASRGCSDDPPPPHDLVGGNIGLVAALEAVAAEGGPGREAARRFLERVRGEG